MIGSLEVMLLSTTNWYLPSASAEIESCAAAAADLQHALKTVQGGGLGTP